MLKNNLIIVGVIIVVAIAGFFAYRATAPKNNSPTPVSTGKNSSLSVKEQAPGKTFLVESVYVKDGGFITVRKDEGGKPGKIIGVSILLPPGYNENIKINLSEETKDGQIVHVLAYTDGDGNGRLELSGLDIPADDASGNDIIARVNIAGTLAGGQAQPTNRNPENNIVAYHNSGFFPGSIEIEVGQYVTFENVSDSDMWIASDPHPSHKALPGFDGRSAVKTGGKYLFVFTQPGVWKYHNEADTTKGGQIIVR
jgi:plastocyanin